MVRTELLAKIEEDVAAIRAALENEIRESRGEISVRDELLLDAICDTERMRREAVAQVKQNGLRERYSNGRQSLERENRAVGQANKMTGVLAKLLASLNTKEKKQTAPEEKGAAADELDDY